MSKISRSFTFDSARSIAATGTTAAIEVAQDDGYSMQAVFAGIQTGCTGTVALQVSNNNTNFADYPSSSQNWSDATTNLFWEVTEKRHRYARLKISATSAGSGTVTSTYFGEVFTD